MKAQVLILCLFSHFDEETKVHFILDVKINLPCFYSDLVNFSGNRTPENSFAVGFSLTKCFKLLNNLFIDH